MKIAVAQVETLPKDIRANLEHILKMVREAKTAGADFFVLPYFALTGFYLGDEWITRSFDEEIGIAKDKILEEAGDIKVIFESFYGKVKDKIFRISYIDENYRPKYKKADFYVFSEFKPFQPDLFNERKAKLSSMAKIFEKPIVYINKISSENYNKNIYAYTGRSAVFNPDGTLGLSLSDCGADMKIYDTDAPSRVEYRESSEIGDIYSAVKIGIKYFMKTVGIERVVIGVSGGIDSAVSAALYGSILPPGDILLVNMPSRYNSTATKNLAETLAKNLGANYAVCPIEESVNLTVKEINGTPITFIKDGEKYNLELSSLDAENIQARDRGARLLAALSSAFSHKNGERKAAAFTCNGNKTECAAGYATLYGDSAGFLAAIADLWKHQVYELAYYLNREVYKREVIPQGIIDIVPSAELSAAQNAEEGKGDPLFYPYHDYLFKAFVERTPKISPEEILKWYKDNTLEEHIGCQKGLVGELFKTNAEFTEDLERWWNQFQGLSVAKRIQSPPIIKLSRKSFGNDFMESQGKPFYSTGYYELKEKLLKTSVS
ncbi:MAG: NAD(+) synthase [Selenomonadaceae bacterium]|nr:NAD(+) synthase [Selenomonadaceae bacterium]